MHLIEAKLGDKVALYVDDIGYISEYPTADTIEAVIIGKQTDNECTLLGWERDDNIPSCATPVSSYRAQSWRRNEKIGYETFVINVEDYLYYYWTDPSCHVAWIVSPALITPISNVTENHTCSCGWNDPYALHDATRTPYKCQSCKLWQKQCG